MLEKRDYGPDFLKVGPAAVKVRDVNSARLGNSLKCWPAAPEKVKYPLSQYRVALYTDRCLLTIIMHARLMPSPDIQQI